MAEEHQHHTASLAIFDDDDSPALAVAAHGIAEAYSTLTRGGDSGLFGFSPAEAMAALDSLCGVARVVGLTPGQTLEAIRIYAASGGIGPRLYDGLIGAVAVAHQIPGIVTWNTRHMRALFPSLAIKTPREMTGTRPRSR